MKLENEIPQVKTCEDLIHYPEEYRELLVKIVRSHAVNELYGARVFDEPAIALAPNPYAKWLTCRVAMEEYGHHVRFRELGQKLNIPENIKPFVLTSSLYCSAIVLLALTPFFM